MSVSPTQRSLKWLRDEGFMAAVVEKWNPHAKIRQDLFGFIDVVAIHPQHAGVIGIQVTSWGNTSSRIRKILDTPAATEWLRSSNPIWVHGWRKNKNRWQVKRIPVTLVYGKPEPGEAIF